MYSPTLQQTLEHELESIREEGLYKEERVITTPQGAVIRTATGDEVINFCANNYLGLSSDPRVIDTAKKTVETHGYGMSSVRFADGFNSVSPDDFTFRNGITTVVDPGSAGWRTIDTFRKQVIEPSQTRVLAFINLVGYGLYGTKYNNDRSDMDPERTLQAIRENDDLIVGVRFGHYAGEDYLVPLDEALQVAGEAGLPFQLECNLPYLDVETVLGRMRPGD